MNNDQPSSQSADASPHIVSDGRFLAYATRIALGTDPALAYPDLATHLVGCAACTAALNDLLTVLAPAFNDTIRIAPAPPPPDLSFLTRATATLQHAGPLLIRLTQEWLQAQLQQSRPPLLGVMRGTQTLRYDWQGNSDTLFKVTIELLLDEATPTQGRVAINVEQNSTDPLNQPAVPVTMTADSTTWQGHTDPTGYVELGPLTTDPLPTLEIEIGGNTSALPLT